jgi:glycosyltransferase involved in cell wall biosynthesis
MLISRFYPFEAGAEKQCRNLSSWLIGRNYELFILTQKLTGLKHSENINNIPVFRVGPPLNNRFGSFLYVFFGFLWLLINRKKFDLLHAHLASSPAILGVLASKILGKPIVLKIAGSRRTGDVNTSANTWYGKIKLGFLLKNINIFVCPSNEIKEELKKRGVDAAKITVIPNGVDTSVYRIYGLDEKKKIRNKLGIDESSTVVIYTGRLEPGKGLEILIDAWKKIEKENSSLAAKLFILGDGSLRKTLEAGSLNLKNVSFAGWKTDVYEYLTASDIYVLPSFGEGLPNSLLEAMSCGLACITTRIGGISEIINNGMNGLLVTPGKTMELYQALIRLLTDKNLAEKLGKSASDFIKAELSMENIGSKYAQLYNEIK